MKGLFDATRENVQLAHYDSGVLAHGSSHAQFLKLLEQVTELGEAIDLDDNSTELTMAIGGMMVLLSSISDLSGVDMSESFESAYQADHRLQLIKEGTMRNRDKKRALAMQMQEVHRAINALNDEQLLLMVHAPEWYENDASRMELLALAKKLRVELFDLGVTNVTFGTTLEHYGEEHYIAYNACWDPANGPR